MQISTRVGTLAFLILVACSNEPIVPDADIDGASDRQNDIRPPDCTISDDVVDHSSCGCPITAAVLVSGTEPGGDACTLPEAQCEALSPASRIWWRCTCMAADRIPFGDASAAADETDAAAPHVWDCVSVPYTP